MALGGFGGAHVAIWRERRVGRGFWGWTGGAGDERREPRRGERGDSRAGGLRQAGGVVEAGDEWARAGGA